MGRLVHLTSRASAVLFLPIRAVFGRFHRRRHTLAEGLLESDQQLPPLPEPWAEDDRWYAGGCPPRVHNRITPRLHGDEYLTDLCETLAGARTRVTICGWCMTPLMSMLRDGQAVRAGSVLSEILREV